MTVKEFKEHAGPMAWPLAKQAKYSRSYFDHAAFKGVSITPDRAEALCAAIDLHIAGMRHIMRLLDDDKP